MHHPYNLPYPPHYYGPQPVQYHAFQQQIQPAYYQPYLYPQSSPTPHNYSGYASGSGHSSYSGIQSHYSYPSPYPGYPGSSPYPGYYGSQGFMNKFKKPNGNYDMPKMINSANQMMNTLKQVSPMVKQMGSLMNLFIK